MYAAAGLPKYWIVRMKSDDPNVLEGYRQPGGAGEQARYHDRAANGYGDRIEVAAWPEPGSFEVGEVLG